MSIFYSLGVLILHASLRINAFIEVLMTFKSYEGFFGAPGAIGE